MKHTIPLVAFVAFSLLFVGATRADWHRGIVEDPLTQDILFLRLVSPAGIPHKPFRGLSVIAYDCPPAWTSGAFTITTSFPIELKPEDQSHKMGEDTFSFHTLRVATKGVAQQVKFSHLSKSDPYPENKPFKLHQYFPFKVNDDGEPGEGYDFAGFRSHDLNEIKIEIPTHEGDVVFTYDVSGFPANPCTINSTR